MQTDKDIRSLVYDYALEGFRGGLNCAECVMDALIRSGAIDVPPETRALCVGFGGGIGLSGFTCGALSSAVMANGAVHGRPDPWSVDAEVRGHEIADKYYRRYNKLVHDFIEQNGSVLCHEICSAKGEWPSKERRKACMNITANTAVLAYDIMQISQEEAFKLPYGNNMAGIKG